MMRLFKNEVSVILCVIFVNVINMNNNKEVEKISIRTKILLSLVFFLTIITLCALFYKYLILKDFVTI